MTDLDLTEEQRQLFARYADQLIPPSSGMPTPSSLDAAGEGLDRLLALRPDLRPPLHRAVSQGVEDVFALRSAEPAMFDAVSTAAAGIYLTEPDVQARLGYPGRRPLDVGDVDQRDAEQWPLTEAVRARGDIWKRTPVADAPR